VEEERVFDTFPSAREIALARQWVKRATRWIPDLKTPKGDQDHRAPGRNRVAYDWLMFLYCFAKGGCLTEHEIETAVWDALAEVAADHPYTETEWEATKDSAYTNAIADRPNDDGNFTPLRAGDADDDGLPPMRPGLFYERGDKDARGFLPVSFVNALTNHLEHYAVGTDGEVYIWKKGVWVPGERDIGTLVVEALGDEYERAQVGTVLDVLAKRRGVRTIDRGPTPEWINVRNGLLDWRTLTLHPHTPDVPSTVQLSVDWDPDAECPEFEAFLAQVLPDDCLVPMEGGPGFVWELIAYMLLSGNPHQIAVLFRGLGRNGKGVFLRVVEVLLGARNIASVSLHELDENRFAAAELYGKTANIVGDLDTKALRGTDVFKRITGGDLIRAEKKFKDAFSFYCWAVPIFSSNRVFTTSDSADGYFERWVIVNFPNSFYGKEDRGLAARLTSEQELQGVLRRAMEALPALMRRGRLPQPGSVADTKDRFVLDSDRVRGWLADNCEFGPDYWTKTSSLWDAYHFGTGGEKDSLGRTEFYLRLDQIGDVQRKKRRGVWGYLGVRLRERSPGDDFDD
jgi:P4 family phage/plasmid primase-like protien